MLRQEETSLRQEEAFPPTTRNGGPVSTSSPPSSPFPEPAEPLLTPLEGVVRPGTDEFAVTPEREGREGPSAGEELTFRKQEGKKDEATPPMNDLNDGEDGPPEEAGRDPLSDAQ